MWNRIGSTNLIKKEKWASFSHKKNLEIGFHLTSLRKKIVFFLEDANIL